MTSHEYRFARQDVVRLAGGPLLVVALFAAALQGLAWLGWLPRPWPALDMDRVVLLHQAEASRSGAVADLVLVGDSSCLMNVDAVRLGERLGIEVLNLGTLSYVDVETHGRLLATFAATHPGEPGAAVLLLHPHRLRLRPGDRYHTEVLQSHLEGRDPLAAFTEAGRLGRWLGLESWRERVLSRVLPWPLQGAYRVRYGFTHDLWRHLEANRGSAVDPNRYEAGKAPGGAEYRLAPGLEAESRAFRRLVPENTVLWAGVTPVPADEVSVAPGSAARPTADGDRTGLGGVGKALLDGWSEWLRPVEPLAGLPFALPSDWFASSTHLNAAGRERYTDLLAEELRGRLGKRQARSLHHESGESVAAE
ncbi:MAG: hypothetical protein HS113_23675 [Verrucomicrobiales bacterium]|nr:hypothetical protein [Verrucomicrobiales bacterium]